MTISARGWMVFCLLQVLVGLSSNLRSVTGFQLQTHARVFSFQLAAKKSSASTNHVPTTSTPPTQHLTPPDPSSTKRMYYIRHGEVINPGGKDRPVYYGSMDVPLSPRGEWEARAAAACLQTVPLSHVFSSPLSRAVYGAQQVQRVQQETDDNKDDNTIILVDGFKELDRGDWCGKTKEEIGADSMARFDACDKSVTPTNGESYPTLKVRVLQARDTALSQMETGQQAALVSHLQVTRCLLSDALDIPTSQMAANIKVGTASITCIDYNVVDGTQTVLFQSFKPESGLADSVDGAN